MVDFREQRLRLNHAERRGRELAEAIQTWAAKDPWKCDATVDADRLGWQLTLHVASPPDVDTWGFIFSESVHHLRALLDNAVVTIGTDAGLTKEQLKRLQFPIAGTIAEWNKQKGWIKLLPENYQVAIQNLQPCQRQGTDGAPDNDLLLLLRDLDNRDKHHVQVRSNLNAKEVTQDFALQFESAEDAERSVPPDVTYYADAMFVDGACLMRQRTKGRIATVKGGFGIQAEVAVTFPERDPAGLADMLAKLGMYTELVLQYLETVT